MYNYLNKQIQHCEKNSVVNSDRSSILVDKFLKYKPTPCILKPCIIVACLLFYVVAVCC